MVALDFGLCFVPCLPDILEDVSTASTRVDPPFFVFLEMLTAPMLSHQILVVLLNQRRPNNGTDGYRTRRTTDP